MVSIGIWIGDRKEDFAWCIARPLFVTLQMAIGHGLPFYYENKLTSLVRCIWKYDKEWWRLGCSA